MTYKFMDEQLFRTAEKHKLNYSYNLNCFNLENENSCKLSVVFMIGGKYSFIININGHAKYLGELSDYYTLFLLSVLRDNLNDKSFPNALKEMYHTHKKIQEIEKELKSDENSTN